MDTTLADSPNAIAIVGMSGRFPGARNLDQFWHNIEGRVESITFFSDEEMLAAGVQPELLNNPGYVKAAPLLDDVDLFDAKFFQFSPREAEITDPQHRLFLECAWEALENAGYCGASYDGAIGVFAGAGPSMSSYLTSETHVNPKLFGPSGSREHIGNDKDYLSTRVSYKLNLRGPSLGIQTACSTSLVAVHLACQSLLMGESDMALAGGVTVRVPQKKGYLIRDNAMASPDGHCRTFDADGHGTIFGSGVGVVVLKRLCAALADRDTIHAVVRGSAVNNDGKSKISYWASSAEGQTSAVVEAMAVADVSPETITCVEAHGTGTVLGDPVEIMGLTRAYRTGTQRSQYCAIGSVKSNVGHLDSAAGITGLIKTVLALKHKVLPPTLHYRKPNPRIDFPNTPFFVNTKPQQWPVASHARRAAVNSLGVGGTNAHVILEEAPERQPVPVDVDRPVHLLALSARVPKALQDLARRYEQHLARHADWPLADVCFTAATGRARFANRLCIVASTMDEARQKLAAVVADESREDVVHGQVPLNALPKIAFLFSTLDTRRLGIGRLLYQTQPTFRDNIQRCAKVIFAQCGLLLAPALFPDGEDSSDRQTHASAELAAFALDYALAELWRDWGAEPVCVAGQGGGEVTAACVAGALPLQEAVKLIAAGPQGREKLLDQMKLVEPKIDVVSGARGQLVTEQVASPGYWQSLAGHSADPAKAVDALAEGKAEVLLEIGPGCGAWTAAAERFRAPERAFLPGLRETGNEWRQLLGNLAALFVRGTPVCWQSFDRDYPRRRVELPTYPFQRKRFWSEPDRTRLAAELDSQDGTPETVHPLLGRRIHSALDPQAILFQSKLHAKCPLLAGQRPLEQTNHVTEGVLRDLARVAASVALSAEDARVDDFTIHAPLSVDPEKTRTLQVAVTPQQANLCLFQVFSAAAGKSDGAPHWTRHVSARLIVTGATGEEPRP